MEFLPVILKSFGHRNGQPENDCLDKISLGTLQSLVPLTTIFLHSRQAGTMAVFLHKTMRILMETGEELLRDHG